MNLERCKNVHGLRSDDNPNSSSDFLEESDIFKTT